MNIEEYKNKGLTGLANLGNTCFINSCIQILSHTYELHEFLNEKQYKKKLNNKYESALLLEWDQLRIMMWEKNAIISPGKFIKTIQKLAHIKHIDIFSGYAQNDLPEFLLFVIDCFHTALSREVDITIKGNAENETDKIALSCFEMIQRMYKKEYSEIWKLFYGIHVSQICSLNDSSKKILSSSPEPFYMINLSIPLNKKQPSIYDCFDLYVEGETLEGDNAWFNDVTGKKENVKKQINFWSLPTILVIDFKRFNNHHKKNQVLIDFPLTDLNLSKYVIGYKKDSYVYDLYGIANHSGSLEGGHYTSFVKTASKKWYHFNDTQVTEVVKLESLVSPKSYCLFYRKRS